MAARNSVKTYIENTYYHIYNRGVEKRDIFLDGQDYAVFLAYLKTYLTVKDESKLRGIITSSTADYREKDQASRELRLKNFHGEIDLNCYALLSNHFHFLVHQNSPDAIDRFMNALGGRFAIYFNHKYHRVGPLFQGVYKAVEVVSDEQLLYLTQYIHLNPLKFTNLPISRHREIQFPSSLPEYLGERQTKWVNPTPILAYFNKNSPRNSYASFMGETIEPEAYAPLALDFEEAL